MLDLAETALEVAQRRIGLAAARVRWIARDVTSVELPPAGYDVWHDRAVFHFLTDPAQRAHYVARVARSVRPGGHVIVGALGPNGPLQCSGLDVVRCDANRLHGEFGPRFELVDRRQEVHLTPMGREQQFVWCFCRVEPRAAAELIERPASRPRAAGTLQAHGGGAALATPELHLGFIGEAETRACRT